MTFPIFTKFLLNVRRKGCLRRSFIHIVFLFFSFNLYIIIGLYVIFRQSLDKREDFSSDFWYFLVHCASFRVLVSSLLYFRFVFFFFFFLFYSIPFACLVPHGRIPIAMDHKRPVVTSRYGSVIDRKKFENIYSVFSIAI